MSSIADLKREYYTRTLGYSPLLSLHDDDLAFYQAAVANSSKLSREDLEKAFYAGVINGSIVIGGAETPTVKVVNLTDAGVTIVSGTPTGTVTFTIYTAYVLVDFNITAAAPFNVTLNTTTLALPRVRNDTYFEHDPSGSSGFFSNPGQPFTLSNTGSITGRVGYIR